MVPKPKTIQLHGWSATTLVSTLVHFQLANCSSEGSLWCKRASDATVHLHAVRSAVINLNCCAAINFWSGWSNTVNCTDFGARCLFVSGEDKRDNICIFKNSKGFLQIYHFGNTVLLKMSVTVRSQAAQSVSTNLMFGYQLRQTKDLTKHRLTGTLGK